MLPYQGQWLVRAFGPMAVTVFEQQVFKLLRLLESIAFMLLVPIALQFDLWVMFLECLGWKKPVSTGVACILTAFGRLLCARQFDWAIPVAIIRFEHFPPPTENFEILIRIDPDRPKSLIYHFAVCMAISIFWLATLIAHMFTMLAKACISIPFVTCSAALLCDILHEHCRGSDKSARVTAKLPSQGEGAPHNPLLCLEENNLRC